MNEHSNPRSVDIETQIETYFAKYVDRMLNGEVLDLEKVRREHPEFGALLVKQLRSFQDLTESVPDGDISATTLGDYTVIRQTGRGGMGVVYEAWQNSLNRQVALKVLPAGVANNTKAATRFMREAQIAAKLNHPNIVQVFGMGIERHIPFYAMELVDGETLRQFTARMRSFGTGGREDVGIDETRQKHSFFRSPTEKSTLVFSAESTEGGGSQSGNREYCQRIAELFIGVANGLQHAHEQGVTHRDIKPSNLIFDRSAEGTSGPARLRILDFGLAMFEGQDTLTATGELIGSVRYMSPEQADQRRASQLDHRTDIYSLGVTLYESLTLHSAFPEGDVRETIHRIIEDEPIAPSRLNPRISKDLETVVLKCMRKDPRSRYESAAELAEDLRRYRQGLPILARPQSAHERVFRWCHRNRGLAATLSTLVLVLLFGLFGFGFATFHFQQQEESQRKLANRQRKMANEQRVLAETNGELARQKTDLAAASKQVAEEARHVAYASRTRLGSELFSSHKGVFNAVVDSLVSSIPMSDEVDLREFAWRHTWRKLIGNANPAVQNTSAAALTEDGRLITANVSGIDIWNVDGTHFKELWNGIATTAAVSYLGYHAAVKTEKGTQLVDLHTGKKTFLLPGSRFRFSNDGKVIATWGPGVPIRSWSVSTGDVIQTLNGIGHDGLDGHAIRVFPSPDGKSFALARYPDEFLFTAFIDKNGELTSYEYEVGGFSTMQCAWSFDGKVLASTSMNSSVNFRHIDMIGESWNIQSELPVVESLQFSPDLKRIVLGGANGRIEVRGLTEWPVPGKERLEASVLAAERNIHGQRELYYPSILFTSFLAHNSNVTSVTAATLSNEGGLVVSRDGNGLACRWDLSVPAGSQELEPAIDKNFGVQLGFEIDADHRLIVSSIYDPELNDRIHVNDRVVAIEADRKMVPTTKVVPGQVGPLLHGVEGSDVRMRFQRDGLSQPWGEILKRTRRKFINRELAYSPDGLYLAVSTRGEGTKVYSLEPGRGTTRKDVAPLIVPSHSFDVAFSKDGKQIATTTFAGEHVIQVQDFRPQEKTQSSPAQFYSAPHHVEPEWRAIEFSPDGRFLAASTNTGSNASPVATAVHIWDLTAKDRSPICSIRRRFATPFLGFTPDGTKLIVADYSGLIEIWSTSDWTLERTFDAKSCWSADISPDGRCLATASWRDGISLWDLNSSRIGVLDGHSGIITALAFSPDGATLASGSADTSIILWDIRSQMQLATWKAHDTWIRSLQFSPDGTSLATYGYDWAVRIWRAMLADDISNDPATNQLLASHASTLAKKGDYKRALAIYSTCLSQSPDNSKLLMERANTYVANKQWRPAANDFVRVYELTENVKEAVRFASQAAAALTHAQEHRKYRELVGRVKRSIRDLYGSEKPDDVQALERFVLMATMNADVSIDGLPVGTLERGFRHMPTAPKTWATHAIAVAAFRRGDLANADEWLSQHPDIPSTPQSAMISFSMGDVLDARFKLRSQDGKDVHRNRDSKGRFYFDQFAGTDQISPIRSACVVREAIDLVNRGNKFPRGSINDLRQRACEAIEKGDYAAAISLYSDCLEQEPDSITLLRLRANTLLAAKRWKEAAEDFRATFELTRSDATASTCLFQALGSYALANDTDGFQALATQAIGRMKRLYDSDSVADRIALQRMTKACLTMNVVNIDDLPISALERSMTDPTIPASVHRYFAVTLALSAFRKADYDAADKWLRLRSGLSWPDIHSLEAMIAFRRGETQVARSKLAEATAHYLRDDRISPRLSKSGELTLEACAGLSTISHRIDNLVLYLEARRLVGGQ